MSQIDQSILVTLVVIRSVTKLRKMGIVLTLIENTILYYENLLIFHPRPEQKEAT